MTDSVESVLQKLALKLEEHYSLCTPNDCRLTEVEGLLRSALSPTLAELDKYKAAIENHLCVYDAADWLACAGGHNRVCILCSMDKGIIPKQPGCFHEILKFTKARAEAAEQALREAQAELAEWRRSETWKEWKALCDQNAESVRKALKLHDDAKAENEKLRDVCRAKPSQDSATPAQDNPKSKTKKKHYHVDLGDFQ